MTDGNTYAINQHLDEREDDDALQEVTAELEQAEARIEELEAKLAEMTEALEKLARLGNGDHYGNSDGNMIAIRALAPPKGRDDE